MKVVAHDNMLQATRFSRQPWCSQYSGRHWLNSFKRPGKLQTNKGASSPKPSFQTYRKKGKGKRLEEPSSPSQMQVGTVLGGISHPGKILDRGIGWWKCFTLGITIHSTTTHLSYRNL